MHAASGNGSFLFAGCPAGISAAESAAGTGGREGNAGYAGKEAAAQ